MAGNGRYATCTASDDRPRRIGVSLQILQRIVVLLRFDGLAGYRLVGGRESVSAWTRSWNGNLLW